MSSSSLRLPGPGALRRLQHPLDLLHRHLRLVDAQEKERARESDALRGNHRQQPAGAAAAEQRPQRQPRQRHSVRMQETDGPLRQDVRRGRGRGGRRAGGRAGGRRGTGARHGDGREVPAAEVLHSGRGAGQRHDG